MPMFLRLSAGVGGGAISVPAPVQREISPRASDATLGGRRLLVWQRNQRPAGHFGRQGQAQEVEDGRGDILERAARRQRGRSAYIKEWHRVGGVRRVRLAGFKVEHLLGVAMIGGDEYLAAGF